MEIFDEVKSNLFKAIEQIINTTYEKGEISQKEVQDILTKYNCNYPSIEKRILCKDEDIRKNLYILHEDDKIPRHYTLSINSKIEPFLTDFEILWLKFIMKNPMVNLFLEPETIQKISNLEPNFVAHLDDNAIIFKNYSKSMTKDDIENIKKSFRLILKAILDKKLIKYTYITRNNMVFENLLGIPVKLQYSLKDDIFYAIIYSVDNCTFAKCIVQNLKSIEVLEDVLDYENIMKDYERYLQDAKSLEPIVLEVSNTRNALERAFCIFSPFEKTARYIQSKNKHSLTIYYYRFEEAEIISRILYIGKDAVVISPDRIRNEIISRVKKALERYGERG